MANSGGLITFQKVWSRGKTKIGNDSLVITVPEIAQKALGVVKGCYVKIDWSEVIVGKPTREVSEKKKNEAKEIERRGELPDLE